jgi:hypothetical protein
MMLIYKFKVQPFAQVNFKQKKTMFVYVFLYLCSGEGDLRTRHAGCPVLLGEKWISNKWIHEMGQEFFRYGILYIE